MTERQTDILQKDTEKEILYMDTAHRQTYRHLDKQIIESQPQTDVETWADIHSHTHRPDTQTAGIRQTYTADSLYHTPKHRQKDTQ